ncbi:HET domain-containing protein [Fusarium sp. Ph1]|nr:HET domain-containing protein [Fusarium sp. Ph1]
MAESSNSKELPPDIYKPLDKDTREIRLFEILPSEDINATVEIRLFCRRLEDISGQFIPFSYVWGDPTDTKPIKVNGMSTAVTRNLADFLKQTRALLLDILTKGSWDKPAIFWADAICINQQDTEERNHQVQLLRSIYSSAPLALAWLGDVRNAHLAASLAESLGPPNDLSFISNLPNLDYSSWMHAHPHLWTVSEGRNAYWEAFKALVQSPYWTRTWTFQEMVLPTHVLFLCGSSLIKWQSIMAVEQLAMALVSMFKGSMLPATEAHRALYSALHPFPDVRATLILGIHKTRRNLVSRAESPSLSLVSQLAAHQVTDPRDKVYGLLGVIGTRLEADYTKDTAQTYREFASTWVDEVKNLNFLLYSQECFRIARHGPNPLPSWAPDWEAISQKEGDIENYPNFGLFMDRLCTFCNACKELPTSNAPTCDDLSTLVVAGVVVGKVEEVCPRWPYDTSNTYFALEVLQFAIKCTSRFGSPSSPRRHIFQALFRTIVTNVRGHSVLLIRDTSMQRSIALCFLIGLLAWAVDSERPDWHRVAAIYLPQLGIPLGQDFSRAWKEEIFKGYSPEYKMTDWESAAAAMEWTWENAKEDVEIVRGHIRMYLGPPLKFVTGNGYLGIATAAQVGDLVVVLADCKAPVLLRRKGSHYEHVGPCFVVGLMEGEGKQMVDRGEAKMETFEIR